MALAAVGCAGPSSSGIGDQLTGRSFLSTALTVDSVAKPLVSGTQISLSFASDALTASAGCNTFSASYHLDGASLVIGQGASTEMGCDAPRMAQDTWLFGLLDASPALALPDADHLSLTAGTTVITFLDRRIAQPDLPLVGRAWNLDTIVSGGAASSVPAGVSASITFGADGSLTFDSGCNGGGGPYSITSGSGTSVGTIAFGDLVMTAMACQEPRASVEAAFITVVKGRATVAYKIDGSSLRLTGGGQELDFRS